MPLAKEDLKVFAQRGPQIPELAGVGGQERNVRGGVRALTYEVADEGRRHLHLPIVAVGPDAGAVVAGCLGVAVVEPEEVVSHPNDVREVHDAGVVLQIWVYGPDEARDLGPHPPLYPQLRNRRGSHARFPHGPPLKLASVELPRHSRHCLHAQRVVHDLRPELSVVANLDEVLDAWHHGGEQVWLHHLRRLLAYYYFRVYAAEGSNVTGKSSGCQADNFSSHQGAAVVIVVEFIDGILVLVGLL